MYFTKEAGVCKHGFGRNPEIVFLYGLTVNDTPNFTKSMSNMTFAAVQFRKCSAKIVVTIQSGGLQARLPCILKISYEEELFYAAG